MGEAVLKKEAAGLISVPPASRSSSKFLSQLFKMKQVSGRRRAKSPLEATKVI
jgi:hypothetical protein